MLSESHETNGTDKVSVHSNEIQRDVKKVSLASFKKQGNILASLMNKFGFAKKEKVVFFGKTIAKGC